MTGRARSSFACLQIIQFLFRRFPRLFTLSKAEPAWSERFYCLQFYVLAFNWFSRSTKNHKSNIARLLGLFTVRFRFHQNAQKREFQVFFSSFSPQNIFLLIVVKGVILFTPEKESSLFFLTFKRLCEHMHISGFAMLRLIRNKTIIRTKIVFGRLILLTLSSGRMSSRWIIFIASRSFKLSKFYLVNNFN